MPIIKENHPSPLGRGIHAHLTEVGVRRKGTDGKFWIVALDKNGRHHWVPLKSSKKTRLIF